MCLSCRKKQNDNDILFWHDPAFLQLLRRCHYLRIRDCLLLSSVMVFTSG